MDHFQTQGGNIFSRPVSSPGYIWLNSARYGLEDNTPGKIGYRQYYRPLNPDYGANPELGEEARRHISEHYDLADAGAEAEAIRVDAIKPITAEQQAARARYGTADRAWAAGDERDWHVLHGIE